MLRRRTLARILEPKQVTSNRDRHHLWRMMPVLLYAENVRQLGGESPLSSLMEANASPSAPPTKNRIVMPSAHLPDFELPVGAGGLQPHRAGITKTHPVQTDHREKWRRFGLKDLSFFMKKSIHCVLGSSVPGGYRHVWHLRQQARRCLAIRYGPTDSLPLRRTEQV